MKKLMLIAVLLVFASGSAFAAAEWNFYGSARVSTFYSSFEDDPFAYNSDTLQYSETDNFDMDLNGNARIGANIKVNDDLTARFEYGAKKDNSNIRILWGEWNFGKGKLGVGQHYTPLLFPYSNMVYNIHGKEDGDVNMSSFGMLYGSRKPMVRLKFGNFQIAMVEPRERVFCARTWNDKDNDGAYDYTSASNNETDIRESQPETEVQLPSIQFKYKHDFKAGHISFAGGYQTFDVTEDNEDFKVESYLMGIGGRVNWGKAYFKANVWGGQNTGNLADVLTNGNLASTYDAIDSGDSDGSGMGYARYSDGKVLAATQGGVFQQGEVAGVTDVDVLAAMLVVGYEIRKGLYVEAGYGYTEAEYDETDSVKDDAETAYIQSTIFLAPGVFITPEIGWYDAKEGRTTTNSTGSEVNSHLTYAGIKWQINF